MGCILFSGTHSDLSYTDSLSLNLLSLSSEHNIKRPRKSYSLNIYFQQNYDAVSKFLVSKDTVMLRRWESET